MTFLGNMAKFGLLFYGLGIVLYILGYVSGLWALISTIIVIGILVDAANQRKLWRWICSLVGETDESIDEEIRKSK